MNSVGWTYLTVIDCKIEVMQRVMCGAVDNFLEKVARDHIRVVDLNVRVDR